MSPLKFDRCIKSGGRVRTIKPKGRTSRTFVRVCYDPKTSKAISGGAKKRKK